MDDKRLAVLFNEWMSRFINEPDRFMREFEAVRGFLTQQEGGATPSYGEECVAYLRTLDSELPA